MSAVLGTTDPKTCRTRGRGRTGTDPTSGTTTRTSSGRRTLTSGRSLSGRYLSYTVQWVRPDEPPRPRRRPNPPKVYLHRNGSTPRALPRTVPLLSETGPVTLVVGLYGRRDPVTRSSPAPTSLRPRGRSDVDYYAQRTNSCQTP